ncbi:MAG: transcription antitermination factor NusB [Mycoplasmatota bacterium]|mgnify:CR=1 FL=1|nr:transcription antitermination factor NusB [Mycoplasmatota bacterium]
MTRHEQRYKIMTILYQAFLYKNNNINYDINDIINEQLEEKNKFIESIVFGVLDNIEKIDELANSFLENWNISRLGYTDQAILRMGIYEILKTDTPDIACINEAIELSKEYSDDKVSKMINGVLDKVYHSKNNK